MAITLLAVASNPILALGMMFPSASLAALSNDNALLRLGAMAIVFILAGAAGNQIRRAPSAQRPVLRRATTVAGLILGSQLLLILVSMFGGVPDLVNTRNAEAAAFAPYWGAIQIALHIALAAVLWVGAPSAASVRHRIPFMLWTVLLVAAGLMDGRTVNDPNLAVPLFALALPATIGVAMWRLAGRIYWPALIPMGLVAAATLTVALDYVVRWWHPTGTAVNAGSTVILNIVGLLYPWLAWAIARSVNAELESEAVHQAADGSPANA